MKSNAIKKICKVSIITLVVVVSTVMLIWKPAEQEIIEKGGLLAYRSVEDLVNDSIVIATGKVAGKSEGFEILHSNGENRDIFTDYYFTIDNVLKGNPYDETVTLRMPGGTVGNRTVYDFCYPTLNQQDEYLLFFYRPGTGGWFNTPGDYYYLYGANQGAYRMDGKGAFFNVDSGEELPAQALISPQLDEPVDEAHFREETEEAFRHNYETGMDSWEEYQYNLAQLDQYAAILP